MKHGQKKPGDMKSDKGPSNNKNKNLGENRQRLGPSDIRSENNSNNNGNITKSKAVFFNNSSPTTKKDSPHNPDEDSNQCDKFVSSHANMEQQKEVDELDLQLLGLLLKGFDNKRIANTTESPLSTIQRRTRLIFQRGLASSKIEPDYKRLGFRKGFLAIRLKGGKIPSILEELQRINGIIAISVNIGAFPVICTIVYKSGTELWNITSSIQELDNIQEVLWSEEIYNYVSKENNIWA